MSHWRNTSGNSNQTARSRFAWRIAGSRLLRQPRQMASRPIAGHVRYQSGAGETRSEFSCAMQTVTLYLVSMGAPCLGERFRARHSAWPGSRSWRWMVSKGGAPRATKCRFCGEGGELFKGAHTECKNRYMRDLKRQQKGYIPPTACRDCGSKDIGTRSIICRDCYKKRQTKMKNAWRSRKRAEKKKVCACGCGRELPRRFTGKYFDPSCRPKVAPKVKRKRTTKPSARITNTIFATRERPYAEPRPQPKPLEGVVIVPANVQVRKLPPAGAAALDFRAYRDGGDL